MMTKKMNYQKNKMNNYKKYYNKYNKNKKTKICYYNIYKLYNYKKNGIKIKLIYNKNKDIYYNTSKSINLIQFIVI